MGVIDVFTDEADLSGITEKAKLKMLKVVRKTLVDVHENGPGDSRSRQLSELKPHRFEAVSVPPGVPVTASDTASCNMSATPSTGLPPSSGPGLTHSEDAF
ncbi:alpha-1-antitrypsin-like protein CM55-MM isoform X2 [Chelonoidis abingdonii]|uniref:alpha-1-antitrypsin-like protein CM55-MM isoform X2 n=1 Tax=Chelonoidis abingdonii TaxID=106734 RepID=UPI003F498C55